MESSAFTGRITLLKMKGQSFFVIGFIVVVFSAVAQSLAIGFEVDTPLDPFLGGLSKIKRQLVRRIKDFGTDENFLNSSPIDQISMLLGQQGLLSPFALPGQSPRLSVQPPLTNQQPLPVYDQRKSGINQIPLHLIQQLDAQLAQLNIPVPGSQIAKRLTPFQSSFGTRQLPNLVQQLTQTLPGQINPQFSASLGQRYL